MIEEIRWLIGLNLVLSLWLGMLADSWKGRRMGVWMVIGMVTSVAGLAILIYMPKVARGDDDIQVRSRFQPTDSYGH